MQVLKRLKNQFLLMNSILIFLVMLFLFFSIYLITYNQIQKSIDEELAVVSSSQGDSGGEYIRVDRNEELPSGEHSEPEIDSSLPDKSITFTIYFYTDGSIHKIYTFFRIETSFYSEALRLAREQDQERGIIRAGGYVWAYSFAKVSYWNSYTFLDVTFKQTMLDRLIVIFIISAVVALFLIFLLSLYLTQRAIRPVKEAFDKQKRFISDVSHELKTPLTVIMADIDYLIKNNTLKENEKWLQLIHKEAENMTSLTLNLLRLAKVEEDEVQLLMEQMNLSQELEAILLGAEGFIYEKGRKLEYSLESDIFYRGIRQNISKICMALLDNAVKYSDPGSLIRVRLFRYKKAIVLEIANHGVGIPPEDLPHIFDRFYRADKARSRDDGSFGLGLAITKSLVEQEHAHIKCRSTVGEETVFSITFGLKMKCPGNRYLSE